MCTCFSTFIQQTTRKPITIPEVTHFVGKEDNFEISAGDKKFGFKSRFVRAKSRAVLFGWLRRSLTLPAVWTDHRLLIWRRHCPSTLGRLARTSDGTGYLAFPSIRTYIPALPRQFVFHHLVARLCTCRDVTRNTHVVLEYVITRLVTTPTH